ncbi:hypothetical protein [uncultured Phascolarctobacterium sp.]|uniref:hypothetical protein n=1 Tax=uncultured Phascolarctobacterium sp. TaxID=512296 RepID=UPI0025FEAE3F|nr:hypothetical protein [uncultured Phascolarctobacterium sp.]
MKVLITGYKYFSKSLASDLQKYDVDNQYIYIDPTLNFMEKIKLFFSIIAVDKLFIIGGCINNSKVVDIALFFKKDIFMEWVGTDVINAKKDYMSGIKNEKYINEIKHCCEINWIRQELLEIGISAAICDIVRVDEEIIIDKSNVKNNTIVAFTYVGKNREEFYGIKNILKLAKLYPEIEFRICGTDGKNIKRSENIVFLGWVNNMGDEFKKCSVFLRFVEHDGLAFSVIEALNLKKWVLYSQPFEHTYSYSSFNELVKSFDRIIKKILNGESNCKGKKYVLNRYGKNKVLNNIVQMLKGIN